jgi:CheY-like chemotaxis protein
MQAGGKDVLIVDDTESNVRLMEYILGDAGYSTATAKSGEQAIELAQILRPKLILLDVMMPGLSGFETCTRLKKNSLTRDIPVIFVTARASGEDEANGFELGAVDYILKPVSEAAVLARVKTHMTLREHQHNLETLVEQRTSALNQTLKELAKSNQIKDEFLAIISHEMRTPLNGIKGSIDLMLCNEINKEQLELIQTCNHSSNELSYIVENVLILTEAIAGTLTLAKKPFRLRHALQSLCQSLESAIKLKKLDFHIHIDDAVPDIVVGDPVQINRILGHLLNNAIKFTLEGHIEFLVGCKTTQATGQQKETYELLFEVSDTGIGIETEQHQMIFELFQQAEMSFSRRFGGLGIGLPISQFLSHSMGGKLTFESQAKQGSVFKLCLPISSEQPPAETQKKPTRKRDNQHYNILIVEDNSINLSIEKAIVSKLGYQVYTATNGKEALEVLLTQHIDAILMDCQMPIMDGFETTRCIRKANNHPSQNVPIIAVTANATSTDRERCFSAGMDDHLAKPINMNSIKTVLTKWLEASVNGEDELEK